MKENYILVDLNWLKYDIKIIDAIIISYIATFHNGCYVTQQELANKFKVTDRTVRRSIALLKNKNLITYRTGYGRRNIYYVNKDKE